MDKGRRLITNTLFNVIQNPLDILVQVFLTPFIVGTLGKSAYGIWTLTGSTLSYIAELRAGLNSAVSYHVPRLQQKQDIAIEAKRSADGEDAQGFIRDLAPEEGEGVQLWHRGDIPADAG